MSFFNNITKEFGNLGIGGDNKREEQYGGGYGEQGQRDFEYQASPPPPPTYQQPSDKPPLPPGWTPQFDRQYQRWYYVEQATGRSQWEAPGQQPLQESRGYGGAPGQGGDPNYGGYSSYGGQGGYGQSDQGQYAQDPEKSNKKGMLLGAAGGLAVGAIGGALVANALDDSDDEHHYAPPPAPPANYGGYSGYGDDSYGGAPPPGILPTEDADGNSVSSSDRESVQEAREEYEEAAADAADSDASSSDQEELEEAREEYYEEYEETYDD